MDLLYETLNRAEWSGQIPAFSWDHSPLRGKTRLWKGPLSWHHSLWSLSHLWWWGKEGILKSNRDQKVSHESGSHGNSEHVELQVWGLKKAAVVKQLGADAQGPLCYFIIVFSAGSIKWVGFLTVLQDKSKPIRTSDRGDCTPDLCRTCSTELFRLSSLEFLREAEQFSLNFHWVQVAWKQKWLKKQHKQYWLFSVYKVQL